MSFVRLVSSRESCLNSGPDLLSGCKIEGFVLGKLHLSFSRFSKHAAEFKSFPSETPVATRLDQTGKLDTGTHEVIPVDSVYIGHPI